jgi:hypothetical protein
MRAEIGISGGGRFEVMNKPVRSRDKQMLLLSLALIFLCALTSATQSSAPEKGPRIGDALPPFEAQDQFGRTETLASLRGPKGLVLLFFRSADW